MAQAVSRKRAKPRAATHGRQRRFGLIWVISCLSIAALAFFSWPTRPAKRAAPVVATAATAPIAEEPEYELRMKPIEDYRLGERFIAINPFGAEDEPEPDPATWKSVRMQLRKPNGDYLKAGFLLSPQKMDEFGVGRLPTVKLDLPEMGISGDAEVLSIGPCPEIEPGEGSVVTGIFEQMSDGNLFNVFFEGDAEPLGVTSNHPFYSLDRGEYVTTAELHRGELLSSAYDGTTARVARIEHRPADELVYNLQVNGHHVYHVGPLAVLVHNACINLHHSIPKVLGGFQKQLLTKLPSNVHIEFHQLLTQALRARGLPPLGGKTGGKAFWGTAGSTAQREAFNAVLDASRAIDVKYGTNIVHDFWQNIIGGQFTPLP